MEFADPIAHNLNTNAPAAEGYGTPFWNMLSQMLGLQPVLPAARTSVVHPGPFAGRDLDD